MKLYVAKEIKLFDCYDDSTSLLKAPDTVTQTSLSQTKHHKVNSGRAAPCIFHSLARVNCSARSTNNAAQVFSDVLNSSSKAHASDQMVKLQSGGQTVVLRTHLSYFQSRVK